MTLGAVITETMFIPDPLEPNEEPVRGPQFFLEWFPAGPRYQID